MLVHRMVQKVKDSKVLAKIGMKDAEVKDEATTEYKGYKIHEVKESPDKPSRFVLSAGKYSGVFKSLSEVKKEIDFITKDSKTKDELNAMQKERLMSLQRRLQQAKQTGGDREHEKDLEEEIAELEAESKKTKDIYTKNRNMRFKIKGDKLPLLKKKVKDVLKKEWSISELIIGNPSAQDLKEELNRVNIELKKSSVPAIIDALKYKKELIENKLKLIRDSSGVDSYDPMNLKNIAAAKALSKLSKKLTGDKKTSDKYILVWQNDKYEIYEDENNEYELVRKSNKAVIGQYATLQGAKLDTKDTYEPMNTKNIAAAKALSKARGMAATDKKTKDERIDRKFIASCPACQEMKKYGLSYEETHSSHTPGKLLVEVDGREREIPNPHIVRDSKTKDEMNLSQALMQAKRELYPGKDYHLLSSEENMDVTIRARDILRESKKTKDEMKFKKADVPDDQFDPIQLKMGIEVENEHTDDPEIAKAIAKAHLSEIGDYYTRLKKMEAEAGVKDEKIFGKSWEQIQAMQQGTYRPKLIKPIAGKDYGADPLGNGKFKMVPSGDIVDFEERNRRLK